MNDRAEFFVWALVRTGLLLTVSAIVVTWFLRAFRVASPTVRRTAYFAVLLQGCLFVQWPIDIRLPAFAEPLRPDMRLDRVSDPTRGAGSRPLAAERAPDFATGEPQIAGTPSLALEARPTEPTWFWSSHESVRTSSFPWAVAIIALWAAGIGVFAGRSIWLYIRFVRRLPRLARPEPDWSDEWAALQRQVGLKKLVPLAVSEQAGPMLCRLPGGYRLIVPRADWQSLEPPQRLLVLRHELAHIQRRDVWKSLGVRVLALPHWFNPLAWRLVRHFDECAEWACDESVGRSAPEQIPDYARALLQLVSRARPVFFATRAARESGLGYRIRRLLQPAKEKGANMKKAAIAVLILGITIVGVARLRLRGPAKHPSYVSASITMADRPDGTAVRADIAAAATPQKSRRAITVMVPRTETRMAAVRKTQMVPVTRTEMVPYTVTEMVPVTRYVDEPNASVPGQVPIVPVADPAGMVVQNLAPADRVMPTFGDTWVPARASTRPRTGADPRLARVDLEEVLERLREFSREKQKVEAEIENSKQAERNSRAELLRDFQERINREQNPVIKDVLQTAMAQKNLERYRENNNLAKDRMAKLRSQMIEKIVGEVARYAKEKHLLVVRRVDRFSVPRYGEVLYSAEAGSPAEADITDEIVDRLNQAAPERQPNVQQGA